MRIAQNGGKKNYYSKPKKNSRRKGKMSDIPWEILLFMDQALREF